MHNEVRDSWLTMKAMIVALVSLVVLNTRPTKYVVKHTLFRLLTMLIGAIHYDRLRC
jgi:hypothetical protein